MPKEDELKQQQADALTKKNNEAIALQKTMGEQLKTMATVKPSEPLKKRKSESPAEFRPTLKTKKQKDWDLILEAFKAIDGMRIDEKTGALIFPSHESSVNFFTEQAKMGREFFVAEYVDDKPTGFHLFSCGNKQIYQGTLDEIKAELEAEIKKNPTNTSASEGLLQIEEAIKATLVNDPTNKMRGALQENRENKEATSPSASSIPENTPKGTR